MTIERQEAADALDDIERIAIRVRQSLVYRQASLVMILWGALTTIGYLVTFADPARAVPVWSGVYTVGIAGSIAIGAFHRMTRAKRQLDRRMLGAFLVFIGFGLLWSRGFGFSGRALSAFWPTYFMMAYTLAGLWIGTAFVIIGIAVTLLTMIGFLYSGLWFDLWMAVVNGGGLVLGGLWMRRG